MILLLSIIWEEAFLSYNSIINIKQGISCSQQLIRLLLNYSPVSSHVISLYSPSALISDPNPNPNPHPHPYQYPESYHNPNPIPNLNPTKKWNLLSPLGEIWSRDQIKAVFCQQLFRVAFFTLRHAGWFKISVEKYVGTCLQVLKILKSKKFLASELVRAN